MSPLTGPLCTPPAFPPPRLVVLDPNADLVQVIADVLLEARHAAQLSQRQLAAEVGVGHSMIAAYENSRRHPTITTLTRLLAATQADVALSLTRRTRSGI